jgi:phosphatidylglycerophosphatase C
MNVYDFDKTVYDGDSSVDFLIFVYKKHPTLWRFALVQLFAALKYKLKITDKTTMKTTIYTYFTGLKDIDAEVDAFWLKHEHKVKDWYKKQRKDDDVIISASPEFLLKPVCERLNVKLIASIVDKHSGKNLRKNCYGDQKPIRFEELYSLSDIDEFYSDSYSDDPMAQLAKKSFLVTGNKITNW